MPSGGKACSGATLASRTRRSGSAARKPRTPRHPRDSRQARLCRNPRIRTFLAAQAPRRLDSAHNFFLRGHAGRKWPPSEYLWAVTRGEPGRSPSFAHGARLLASLGDCRAEASNSPRPKFEFSPKKMALTEPQTRVRAHPKPRIAPAVDVATLHTSARVRHAPAGPARGVAKWRVGKIISIGAAPLGGSPRGSVTLPYRTLRPGPVPGPRAPSDHLKIRFTR
jgi:hypothetical protein